MDLTNASDQRLQAGVELLLEGHTFACDGIVVWRDKERALAIYSYSDWEPERSTPAEGKSKISRAKAVFAQLTLRNAALRALAERMPQEHFFCHDYGMGSFALAKEIDGKFEWLLEHR